MTVTAAPAAVSSSRPTCGCSASPMRIISRRAAWPADIRAATLSAASRPSFVWPRPQLRTAVTATIATATITKPGLNRSRLQTTLKHKPHETCYVNHD